MNKVYLSIMLTAAIAATLSCNKKENTGTPSEGNRIDLRTSIAATGTVKSPSMDDSGAGNFNNGDTFSLFITNEDGMSSRFSYTVGESEIYWDDVTSATGSGSLVFSACYPAQDTDSGVFTFDLAGAAVKDLLTARTADVEQGTENPVNLTFGHAMHRLNIVFKAETPETDTDNISTKCTALSSCEVNLPEGTIDISNAGKSDFTGTGDNPAFILVPQSTSEVSLEITIGSRTSSFVLSELKPEIKNLESGMQLTVEFNVKNDTVTLGSMTIEGWGDQGTIEGEIIL